MTLCLRVSLLFCIISLIFSTTSGTSVLRVGEGLVEGELLISNNGQFTAALQTDGNFVVYKGSTALWATYTNNNAGTLHLVVQSDGNLVIYTAENSAIWATYTFDSNVFLVMQDDGNLVLYNGNSQALWNTNDEVNKPKIIANADTWLHPPVSYSQAAYYNGYRQDCSGYVSMAWQLGISATTWTIPNYSHQISKSELKAGDILLNTNEHVLIFNAWADGAQTQYWAYEQTPPQTIYHVVTYPYWPGYGTYLPYRLTGMKGAGHVANEIAPHVNLTSIEKN